MPKGTLCSCRHEALRRPRHRARTAGTASRPVLPVWWHDEGAAVGGAFTGAVWAGRAAMLGQAPAPAGADAAMTGVVLAVSRRPRR
jgi:hypothetical protein